MKLDLTQELDKEAKVQLKSIEDAAFERGKAEGIKTENQRAAAAQAEAMALGAKTERERIQAVLDVSLPGHEALVQELAFDGKTTAPEAAQRVLAAEKTARDRRLANLKADAPPPAPAAVAPPSSDSVEAEAKLPVEERAKKQWDRDPELRAEFNDNFKAYLAFANAQARGTVSILTSKRTQ
jgi:hypothetical protein